MRNYTTSQSTDNLSRQDSNRSNHNNNNRFQNNNNNNSNNNDKGQRNFERKRDFDRQDGQPHQQRFNQYQTRERNQPQADRDRSSNRDRSGQRSGLHPDSSMMGRENPSSLGSVRFTPGLPTIDLPPIETKPDPSKKFTGRCRLFVGNLPHNTNEDQVKTLFEPFGEIGEIYLGPKSSFAFVKMDTRQNAEAARDALDCGNFDGRSLRVRLAAHAAAIKVKNLSPVVTNELLAYAFRYFGEIERAVIIVDDKGKSTGEGIVEYSRKQSAQYAIKRCQQECFMLTQAPVPVLVEAYDQHDEEEGLPEKSVNKHTEIYKEQRDVGPRFAEQGSFEHSFALRWKELYQIEKQKRDILEQEILDARNNLQNTIELSRLDHKKLSLTSQLQQLEDNRIKLQQMKEQTLGTVQQREEQRRQQEMLAKQRQEEILHSQQLANQAFFNQQDTTIRTQAQNLQGMTSPEGQVSAEQGDQQNYQSNNTFMNRDSEQNNISVNPMLGTQSLGVPGPVRNFADAAMLSMGYIQQPPMGAATIPVNQTQSSLFPGYIPPPTIQTTLDDSNTGSFGYQTFSDNQQSSNNSNPRQQKFNNNNNRQFSSQGNNINLTGGNGRARKRGRF